MIDKALCVILGSIVGSGVTYILMRKKCEQEINEEVKLMKEHYEEKYGNKTELAKKVEKPVKEQEDKPDVVVADLSKKQNKERVDYSGTNNRKEERMISLITSERFDNEEPDYEKITLTYYENDSILADSYGDVVEIESSIGPKGIEYFSLLHQDVIYIRNSRLKIDYEVVLEHSKYGDFYEAD